MPSNSRLMLACYCLRHLIPLRHDDARAKGYIVKVSGMPQPTED